MNEESELDRFANWQQKLSPDTSKVEAAEDEYDPDLSEEPTEYQPFLKARDKRRACFVLVMANHERFWVYYHDIRDLRYTVKNGFHFIEFAHQSLAVTMKGRKLLYLATMIGEGKLKAIFEPNGLPVSSLHTTPTEIIAVRATLIGGSGKGDKGDDKVVPIGAAKSA